MNRGDCMSSSSIKTPNPAANPYSPLYGMAHGRTQSLLLMFATQAMERFQRVTTSGSTSGSWTFSQPHPSISSKAVPVYSYHRRL